MPPRSTLAAFALAIISATFVAAEKHLIRFENHCGRGTPKLIVGGKVLSTGEDYWSNGPISAGIAYLDTGECLFNGENCALMEMTLANPTCIGCASSSDISLIPPHALNVVTGFEYFNGCDGVGALCKDPHCNTAFFVPDDNQVQVQCNEPDVNLLITFCKEDTAVGYGVGGERVGSTGKTSPASTSKPTPKPTTSQKHETPAPKPTSTEISSSLSRELAPTSVAPTSLTTGKVNRKSCKTGGKPNTRRHHQKRNYRF